MRALRWLLILFIWLALLSSMAVTWSLLNLPETESIQISRQPSITFLDKDGRIIASYGDIYGKSIKYQNLPENLINAVIVTEDKRFFSASWSRLSWCFTGYICKYKRRENCPRWEYNYSTTCQKSFSHSRTFLH